MPEVVLIVDDDPVQRRLLEAMIQRFGYQTMLAEGGDDAVKLLVGPEAPRIDGVVLDLVMPDLDGLGVLAHMREAGLNIPVIVQTGHGGIDNVVSVMRAGATDFVVKPASAERLQVSLHNALANKAPAGELQRLKRRHDGTLTIADGDEVGVDEFPQITAQISSDAASIQSSPAMVASWPERAEPLTPTHSLPLTDPYGDVRPLDDIERDAIRFAISHYRGQMSEVARRLRIGRSTLYRKLEGLGLDEDVTA
jgi:DNA-binding NtrC family response regulator